MTALVIRPSVYRAESSFCEVTTVLSSYAYPMSTRPVVMGVNGMVASANPFASMAGVRMLQAGGNAFDAAVAVASTLGVVEPFMSGPGGIGVALMYVAKEKRLRVLNFSGRAPKKATPDQFTQETKDIGVRSALVPGNALGWLTFHEAYGRLEREQVFAPAIDLAENGFGVTYFNYRHFIKQGARLQRHAPSAALLFDRQGKVPDPGERHRFPQLAGTYKRLAKEGADVFYRGEIAEKISRAQRDLKGLITKDDLAAYKAEWEEPISITYRGYEMFTTPPNSTGFQILQTLKLMETYDPSELKFQHPDTAHAFIEAVKLCVTDRLLFGGDPDYVKAPLRTLLSDSYARKQRRRIHFTKPTIVAGEQFVAKRPVGSLVPLLHRKDEVEGGMTTHFAVADRDGNVVSITQTLGGGFGSAVVMGDTGVFLNNMAYWFDLDEASPNRIAPWKRVDFCVAPVQAFHDGKFFLSLSTPGSWGILQTTPQMLMNVLDFGMNVQQAVDQPRLRVYENKRVEMEERFPVNMRTELEQRGHDIQTIESWSLNVGGAQAIQFDAREGVFQGGADPRRDGVAMGY
ncbi:MAG: gamma-glutamyltransferase [SAR202 cluster bacterium]|nr:gamma-glutamyltransferase [SAR202 cluster bacterium]